MDVTAKIEQALREQVHALRAENDALREHLRALEDEHNVLLIEREQDTDPGSRALVSARERQTSIRAALTLNGLTAHDVTGLIVHEFLLDAGHHVSLRTAYNDLAVLRG